MRVETIDIEAKEWFDKVNGNSYFSGVITLNYGMNNLKFYKMPFQYGYGNHYIDMATQLLYKENILPIEKHENGTFTPLWKICKDKNIILRTTKYENCKKRDL